MLRQFQWDFYLVLTGEFSIIAIAIILQIRHRQLASVVIVDTIRPLKCLDMVPGDAYQIYSVSQLFVSENMF